MRKLNVDVDVRAQNGPLKVALAMVRGCKAIMATAAKYMMMTMYISQLNMWFLSEFLWEWLHVCMCGFGFEK